MKLYLIYYLPSKAVYAWTFDKKIALKFLDERYKKKFYLKKVNDDEQDIRYFIYENKDKKLIDIPLYTDGKDITLTGTVEEEGRFNCRCDDIQKYFEQLQYMLSEVHWNKKYRKIVEDATNIINKEPGKDSVTYCDTAELDTFSIFYDEFLSSFVSDEECERRRKCSLM